MTLPKPILTILRRLLLGLALLVLAWLSITVFFALKPLPPESDKADRHSIATGAPLPQDAASALHDEKHCKQSLPVFWKQFRAAVLKEDWDAVAGMTASPMTVLRQDYEGKYLNRQDFAKYLPLFLDAVPKDDYPGVQPRPASMRKLIEAISVPVLAKKTCKEYYYGFLTVGTWGLYYRPEGWVLGEIRVDAFPTSMNHIQTHSFDNPDDDHHKSRNCEESVYPFWAKFRAAILKEDWERVADLTQFPFSVLEPHAPKKELSRTEFIKRLPELLKASPGDGYASATMKAYIQAMPTLEKGISCGEFGTLNLGIWDFHLRPEGWRLGAVDTATPAIDKAIQKQFPPHLPKD